jgi:DNA-binding CsgD family transcriptional regulator
MQTPYPWYAAEAALWLCRAGQLPPIDRDLPPQFAHEIQGDFAGAAEVWQQLGCPYEQACALFGSNDVSSIRLSLSLARKLGALPLAAMLVDRLHQLGTRPASPRPYARTSSKWTRTNDHWTLSRRELEVASLVAQAYTNREIAERLRISERTAEKHVQNILNRLGMRSRTQAAAWAVQHGVGPVSTDS